MTRLGVLPLAAFAAGCAILSVPPLALPPRDAADLLVFRADPTRDLDALDSLEAVVADGRLYTRSELDAQLARYQELAEGTLYDAISVMLVRRALKQAMD